MAATATVEAWVCIDSDGNYAVGMSEDDSREQYTAAVGALEDTDGHRLVRLTVKVPLPVVLELEGEAPADEAPGKLVVS